MQRDTRMPANVGELGRVRLAEDEHGILIPDEPDRARLRGQVAADGGEPDHEFAIEQLLGGAAEFGIEVDQSWLSIKESFLIIFFLDFFMSR